MRSRNRDPSGSRILFTVKLLKAEDAGRVAPRIDLETVYCTCCLGGGSAAGTRHTVYAKQRFSPCLQVGISDDQRGNCAQRDSNSGLIYYSQLNAPYEHYTPYVVEIARDTCSEDVVGCNFIAECKILENISRIKTS